MNFKRLKQRVMHKDAYSTPVIGEIIKRKRSEDNVTQEVMARGLCSVSYLSKVENNKIEPKPYFINEMSARIGYDLKKVVNQGEDSLIEQLIEAYFKDETDTIYKLCEDIKALEQDLLTDLIMIMHALMIEGDMLEAQKRVNILENLVPYMTKTQKIFYLFITGEMYYRQLNFKSVYHSYMIIKTMKVNNHFIKAIEATRLFEACITLGLLSESILYYEQAKRRQLDLMNYKALSFLECLRIKSLLKNSPQEVNAQLDTLPETPVSETNNFRLLIKILYLIGEDTLLQHSEHFNDIVYNHDRYALQLIMLKSLYLKNITQEDLNFAMTYDDTYIVEKTIIKQCALEKELSTNYIKDIIVPLCIEHQRLDTLNYFKNKIVENLESRSRYKELLAFERKIDKATRKMQMINL